MPDSLHPIQKEEAVNTPQEPENFGTPAHPKPKYMRKNTAIFLGFVITSVILSFIFGGIFLAGN